MHAETDPILVGPQKKQSAVGQGHFRVIELCFGVMKRD
jgi:hypothetical protein